MRALLYMCQLVILNFCFATERSVLSGGCRISSFNTAKVRFIQQSRMRQNQLLNIRLEDVHLEGGWINLRPEASKNHREHRVPITRLLRPRLERLMLAAVERGAAHGDMLFNASRFDGRKNILTDVMAYQPLRGFFRRLSTECQCVITPHRFRHTIATDMMKSPDRNLKVVQTLLGHSSVAVTLEYVEGNMDSLRVALDEVFGG